MKTFLPFESMTLNCDSGSRHDFPRLARESGFSFNLYRGRVDWAKIGAIDVDRIIRERDLETLQDVLSSVMSCSLSSEYDLKVLDPNFVKIFQLAQLGADFLLYCRNYLDHCVTVMQEQLRVALQEIEHVQKLNQQNANDIDLLQKKLKAKSKPAKPANSSPLPMFKCSGCEKVFVGEHYLLAHLQRRHPELPGSELPLTNATKEVESLRQQIQELQDRLHATEEALKLKQDSLVPDVATLQAMLQSELQKIKSSMVVTPSPAVEVSEVQQTQSGPQHMEVMGQISETHSPQKQKKNTFSDSVENEHLKLKHEAAQAALVAQVEQQNHEIKMLREQLQEQHQTHALAMQRKLEELQHQHQSDLDDLRISITKSRALPRDASANEDTPQLLHQETLKAWEESDASLDSSSKTNAGKALVPPLASKSNVILEQRQSSTTMNPPILESKTGRAKEEPVLREEYISPTDQESSDSSSQTSSSPEPVSARPTDDNISSKKNNSANLSLPRASETVDLSDHAKSMYGKSSSSGSGSSSESGSSSYDSDSQSSNSEQHHSPMESGGATSRSQLAPEVLDGLKDDLLGLLNRRLRELGVDPEWNELPIASFRSNLATVKHHQNIAARTQSSYFAIQEQLLKEVDKRVAEHLKSQPEASTSKGEKKKRTSGSFSIFARIKSHVKNKLSHSGHSSPVSKHSPKSVSTANMRGNLVENEYSQEPSTSNSKSSHEYEVLVERTLPAELSTAVLHAKEGDFEYNHSSSEVALSKPSNLSDNLYESGGEKEKPSTAASSSGVKVYSRSMYANLNRSEVEIEKRETVLQPTRKEPAQLQTSTPIKSSSLLSETGLKKPTFISSDIDSISELESDLNEIIEIVNEKSTAPPKPRPHTSLTTAELLANVAKFRQSTAQINLSQSIAKSNLKSSLSTGNIMKKKVVFRDEKDGFDTIELGPAHSSHESLTPQRSHSDNSLAITYSSPSPPDSDRPTPQPRSSLVPATATVASTSAANNDSDGDWDWDNEDSESLTPKKSDPGSPSGERRDSSSAAKDSKGDTSTLSKTLWADGSKDTSTVSDIVKDLEKKLQRQIERPSFGVSITAPLPSAINTSNRFANLPGSNFAGRTMAAVPNNNKTLPEDRLLDLLLDDVSSS